MRRYEIPEKSEWAEGLPDEYYSAIVPIIYDLTSEWFSEQDKAEGYDDYIRASYVYGRMQQCALWIMPWIRAAIPDLQRKRVLEVGCGNGPSTPPIAMDAAQVFAFDITEAGVDVAARRCRLLGLKNVQTFVRPASWIEDYFVDPNSVGVDSVDVIFCYALLEHLTPIERYKMLRAAWRHIDVGGYLVIVELPNRLHWFDWHSSQLAFSDWLPEDLALLWYAKSGRSNIWPSLRITNVEDLDWVDRSNLYRYGRGASFHEFSLAIGFENMEIVGSGYGSHPLRRSAEDLGARDSGEWTALLEKKLADMNPPVSRDFAPPCLDLIIRRVN